MVDWPRFTGWVWCWHREEEEMKSHQRSTGNKLLKKRPRVFSRHFGISAKLALMGKVMAMPTETLLLQSCGTSSNSSSTLRHPLASFTYFSVQMWVICGMSISVDVELYAWTTQLNCKRTKPGMGNDPDVSTAFYLNRKSRGSELICPFAFSWLD